MHINHLYYEPFFQVLSSLIVLVCSLWQAALVVAIWCAPRRQGPDWGTAGVLLGVGLWLCTNWSSWIYHYLPFLGRIQFAWRCLGMTTPAWALLAALLATVRRPRGLILGGAGLWLCFLLWQGNQRKLCECTPSSCGVGVVYHYYDYVPKTCPNGIGNIPDLPLVEVLEGQVSYEVVRWVSGERVLALEVRRPARLLLRLFADPRWQAVDQDGRPLPTAWWLSDQWGRLAVDVPAGTTRLEVRLVTTPARWLGRTISALTLIGFAGAFWQVHRRRCVPQGPG